MKFTLQMFWEEKPGKIEPFLKPLPLDFATTEQAREVFSNVTDQPKIPIHSLTLKSEDGLVSERWFKVGGEWRQKPD